ARWLLCEAEDGIRDLSVTGVQTCALPISIAPYRGSENGRIEAAAPVQYGGELVGAVCARWTLGSTYDLTRAPTVLTMTAAAIARSEERREGNEVDTRGRRRAEPTTSNAHE